MDAHFPPEPQRPLIGLCGRTDPTGEYLLYFRSYAMRVFEAGGLPLGLPYHEMAAGFAPELAERLDGIVFTGGSDIDNGSFGGRAYDDATHHALGQTMPLRDAFEGALLEACWELDVPCLGICRGVQLMCVGRGGTLVRDVTEQDWSHGANLDVHLQTEPFEAPVHQVYIEPNSRLAKLLGTLETSVNSLHHLAICTVPEGAHVTARADDGTPEALEFPDRTFFLGVQWHPEIMGTQPQLFEALVDAANQRRQAKGR